MSPPYACCSLSVSVVALFELAKWYLQGGATQCKDSMMPGDSCKRCVKRVSNGVRVLVLLWINSRLSALSREHPKPFLFSQILLSASTHRIFHHSSVFNLC